MHLNTDSVTRIIEEVTAEEILPRFRSLAAEEVGRKAAGEVVTVVDVAAEERLGERLRDLMPGSLVIGEEAATERPRLLDDLAGSASVWVIDPLDGTANFASGTPIFAVMVALISAGQAIAGWIHDPIGCRTAVSELGQGAWMAGRRLTAARPASPREMRGTLHASQFATPEMNRLVQGRRNRVGAIRSLRCAGYEYLRLATGEMHFSFFTKLMPWDHAPGTLIHREAGGVGRFLDGRVYQPLPNGANGLLLAPDERSWYSLRDILFGDDA